MPVLEPLILLTSKGLNTAVLEVCPQLPFHPPQRMMGANGILGDAGRADAAVPWTLSRQMHEREALSEHGFR